jgi:hypothetical protein
MAELPTKEEWFRSPKRYFLDAPKEQPGTCFVKNDDYVEAIEEIRRQSTELVRHESDRVILTQIIEALTAQRDKYKQRLIEAQQFAVRQGNELRKLRQ